MEEESFASRYLYDVFLSFRGVDTRHTFTDRLYTALDTNGVRTFRDDPGLDRGSEIAPSLLAAIEDSAASIVVLSKNYANSRWCLEELAKILECRRLILPVFYLVDPSDVRRCKGPFQDDFRNHEEVFGEDSDKVLRWKKAFEKVGGLSGWDSKNCEESDLIHALVKIILNKLSNTPLRVAEHPVGINSRLEEVMKMLDVKSKGVRIVGFHGMGGIGKTTLARAVYNRTIPQFKHRCFISNIRTTSRQRNGLVFLQNKLIGDLFRENGSLVDEVSNGIALIKERIHDKRVLVVLDDVDDISQLDALAVKKEWYAAGSRILITTRDNQVLVQPLVNKNYEVKTLDPSESLQLFSYHAFGKVEPTESFMHLSKSIVSRTGQLPLTLQVIGASLLGNKRKNEWQEKLEKLKKILPGDIHSVLKISFDGLDEDEQCIFLDIACFFVDMEMQRESVIDILKGCGFAAEVAITVLTAKSLIKIVDDSTLWMHDQLRDMGRQIVRQECPVDPGRRSRLWDPDDINSVLKHGKGTRSIQGITLSFEKTGGFLSSKRISEIINRRRFNVKEKFKNPFKDKAASEDSSILNTKPFAPIVNLRLLQINHASLKGQFKLVPGELKWLQWKGCPLVSLPYDFCLKELAVLDLTESKIKQVWDRRWSSKKMAMKLMVLILLGCYNLTATPDFSEYTHLEKLILERCTKLKEIHKSIGDLKTLRILNLNDCPDLVEFPDNISGLRSLEIFTLSGCSKLKRLPEDLKSMRSLKEFLLDKTAIVKLPDSIGRVTKLERLSLNDCTSLKELPYSIGKLSSLRELSVNGSSLEEIPDSIGCLANLESLSLMRCRLLFAIPDSIGRLKSLLELYLDSSSIKELPLSVGSLSRLKHLSVGSCRLEILPSSIGGLASLVELRLDKTLISELPVEVGNLQMLRKLDMKNCESLRYLPNSVGNMWSLKSLALVNSAITELPDSIGKLENLEILNVNQCKQLRRLPSSIGNLKHLCQFLMEDTGVAELPDEIGMLSSLMILKMVNLQNVQRHQSIGEHRELTVLDAQENLELTVLPASFSKLSLLQTLDAKNCMISGIIPDDYENLSSLEDLDLSKNVFCKLPSCMRGLSHLKRFSLTHCVNLKSLPPLPSSLIFLDATNCDALETISDISNLSSLEELRLTNCKNVVDIPGLECLKSLKWLFMSGCTACHSVIKRKLSKGSLRHLRNLSVPGSEIPKWFAQKVQTFVSHRNRKLKCVIICVVISLDQQQQDDFRDRLPSIVDIQARIVRDGRAIFTTALYLIGVPNSHENQFYLCQYFEYSQLVTMLKDGDKIEVTMRNPPLFNGLQLKKYGIRLVFEDDDDDDDDNEKLAMFLSSSNGNALLSDSDSPEVQREVEENEGRKSNHKQ